jgi:hypothetical protein
MGTFKSPLPLIHKLKEGLFLLHQYAVGGLDQHRGVGIGDGDPGRGIRGN